MECRGYSTCCVTMTLFDLCAAPTRGPLFHGGVVEVTAGQVLATPRCPCKAAQCSNRSCGGADEAKLSVFYLLYNNFETFNIGRKFSMPLLAG